MPDADKQRKNGQIILQGETQGADGPLQLVVHLSGGDAVSVGDLPVTLPLELVCREDLPPQFWHLGDLPPADLQNLRAEHLLGVAAFDGARVVIHDAALLHQNLFVDGLLEIPVPAIFQAFVPDGLVEIGFHVPDLDALPAPPDGRKALVDNILRGILVAHVGVCNPFQLLSISVEKLFKPLAGQFSCSGYLHVVAFKTKIAKNNLKNQQAPAVSSVVPL